MATSKVETHTIRVGQGKCLVDLAQQPKDKYRMTLRPDGMSPIPVDGEEFDTVGQAIAKAQILARSAILFTRKD